MPPSLWNTKINKIMYYDKKSLNRKCKHLVTMTNPTTYAHLQIIWTQTHTHTHKHAHAHKHTSGSTRRRWSVTVLIQQQFAESKRKGKWPPYDMNDGLYHYPQWRGSSVCVRGRRLFGLGEGLSGARPAAQKKARECSCMRGGQTYQYVQH